MYVTQDACKGDACDLGVLASRLMFLFLLGDWRLASLFQGDWNSVQLQGLCQGVGLCDWNIHEPCQEV